MKNIHILPTDKPSRLLRAKSNGNIFLDHHKDFTFDAKYWEYLNIYITSDEEIKEGDLFIGLQNQISKATNKDIFGGFEKKIILTTDTQLIADGVQPIPEEFLEWFVKNPSCEFVDFEYGDDGNGYQIIIPKEEPTLANMKCTCMRFEANCFSGRCKNCGFTKKEQPKESIEEVAEKKYPLTNILHLQLNTSIRTGFIEGYNHAKQTLYTEEDVFTICGKFATFIQNKRPSYKKQLEWFGQFKKK